MRPASHTTRVKICGITRPDLAVAAARAGADFFGLVFYPPSHRNVTPQQAREIVAAVRRAGFAIPAVGVFVNCPVAEMNRLAEYCPLDYIQLHGDEPWEIIRLLNRPVIKAVRIAGGTRKEEEGTGGREPGPGVEEVEKSIRAGLAAAGDRQVIPILDSLTPDKYGGTGLTLDLDVVAALSRTFNLLVAGGLTPDNVGELVRHARPWGVDVSGGVETGKVKDVAKIEAFIRAVRQAQAARP